MGDATRRIATGEVARLWRVSASRVRQILRDLGKRGELPEGIERTPGGHARVPLSWAQEYRRIMIACAATRSRPH
jgi:hypothetical protein